MLRLFLLSLFVAAPAVAQAPPSCDTPAHDRLDFWTGTWDLSWTAGPDSTATGTNTITRAYDGCVIEERFVDPGGYEGMSVSVLDRRAGQWRQTWTDNQGGYLLFTGRETPDGGFEFRTAPFQNPQGQTQVSRMTWLNVTPDGFDWHWQRSLDDGTSWTDMWVIHYTRR